MKEERASDDVVISELGKSPSLLFGLLKPMLRPRLTSLETGRLNLEKRLSEANPLEDLRPSDSWRPAKR